VDENEAAKAVPLGVTKVDIDTDGRLVWTRVHRESFRDQPNRFDLRDPGKVFIRHRFPSGSVRACHEGMGTDAACRSRHRLVTNSHPGERSSCTVQHDRE
jgi:hypothetical protein